VTDGDPTVTPGGDIAGAEVTDQEDRDAFAAQYRARSHARRREAAGSAERHQRRPPRKPPSAVDGPQSTQRPDVRPLIVPSDRAAGLDDESGLKERLKTACDRHGVDISQH
jgi:hypothetical protein